VCQSLLEQQRLFERHRLMEQQMLAERQRLEQMRAEQERIQREAAEESRRVKQMERERQRLAFEREQQQTQALLDSQIHLSHHAQQQRASISVEQRLIGMKKDPDQEAFEHGQLLSLQVLNENRGVVNCSIVGFNCVMSSVMNKREYNNVISCCDLVFKLAFRE
jgi:hypothetical protein